MQVRFSKLTEGARAPVYATPGAAAFDLFANNREPVTIYPDYAVVFDTGIAVEVPEGHVLLLFSRSGHGFKHSTRLGNCVGVVDPDYRGSVQVKLIADENKWYEPPLRVSRGDRIAQGLVVAAPRIELVEVDALPGTERGAGGLGSTGA